MKGGEIMANLTFSPEQARAVAGSIKRKGADSEGIINQLQREIHDVAVWWKGESAEAFVQEFDQLKPSLDKLIQCVNNISTQLNKVAEIKERSENEMAAQLRK
jgi:WXG100 family type VII secretion target